MPASTRVFDDRYRPNDRKQHLLVKALRILPAVMIIAASVTSHQYLGLFI
ncbi:hypothetical protein MBT84_46295 [Streptomyces sp. MBT84]|nr:hypothetical protein [Streptomyces sp. MBT84]